MAVSQIARIVGYSHWAWPYFCFLTALEFEIRASHLLDRCLPLDLLCQPFSPCFVLFLRQGLDV
jgi:hypothetical protein